MWPSGGLKNLRLGGSWIKGLSLSYKTAPSALQPPRASEYPAPRRNSDFGDERRSRLTVGGFLVRVSRAEDDT